MVVSFEGDKSRPCYSVQCLLLTTVSRNYVGKQSAFRMLTVGLQILELSFKQQDICFYQHSTQEALGFDHHFLSFMFELDFIQLKSQFETGTKESTKKGQPE